MKSSKQQLQKLEKQNQLSGPCVSCNSYITSIHKRTGKELWHKNKEGKTICSVCKRKQTQKAAHDRWNHILNKRLIRVGLQIRLLGYDFRTYVCNWCRSVAGIDCKRTHMHHDMNQYDYDNPLKNAIELCDSCHSKETARLLKLGIKGPYHKKGYFKGKYMKSTYKKNKK